MTTPGGGITAHQRGGYETNNCEEDQSFVEKYDADVITERGCTAIKTGRKTVPGQNKLRGGRRDDRQGFISTSTPEPSSGRTGPYLSDKILPIHTNAFSNSEMLPPSEEDERDDPVAGDDTRSPPEVLTSHDVAQGEQHAKSEEDIYAGPHQRQERRMMTGLSTKEMICTHLPGGVCTVHGAVGRSCKKMETSDEEEEGTRWKIHNEDA